MDDDFTKNLVYIIIDYYDFSLQDILEFKSFVNMKITEILLVVDNDYEPSIHSETFEDRIVIEILFDNRDGRPIKEYYFYDLDLLRDFMVSSLVQMLLNSLNPHIAYNVKVMSV